MQMPAAGMAAGITDCQKSLEKECHCEERSDVAIRIPHIVILTKFPSYLQHWGERIATPVCGLVRNDSGISLHSTLFTLTARAKLRPYNITGKILF